MKRYEKFRYGENLGWCKPYISEDGKTAFCRNELGICGAKINGVEVDVNRKTPDEAIFEEMAKAVNPECELYKGWGWSHIAKDAMHEVGCSECPWRDECEAMDFESADEDEDLREVE